MPAWPAFHRSPACGAALGALVLYALLGTSSRLSVGPDSASALLVGSAVAIIGADVGPQERAQIAAALALAVGAIALLAWTTRLGFLLTCCPDRSSWAT